ncbi:efflux RND transporter permease subunit [Agarilytica rhodophyticola]|uniref:efflux RND transporter permease subunit n=1 Tax=Agarilytica rhodophyticola TaxID=1737490 RepID=UPI003CCBE858
MRLFFNQYVHIVTHYPKLILLAISIITLGLVSGLPNFKLDASADSLTLENDKDLNYFREISQQYQSGDFLVVTFRPNEDLFSDASLALLGKLKQDLAAIDGVSGVNTILDVPLLYSPLRSLPEIVTQPLTLLSPGVDRKLAAKEFLESPIYKELILGPDGQTTALQLNIAIDSTYIKLVNERERLRIKRAKEGLTEAEKIQLAEVSQEFLEYRTEAEARSHARVERVREVVASYKNQAQLFVGGVTMITADMITFIQSDLVVFGTAVIIFMIAILALIFRRLRFVVIPMLSCIAAVLMMLGYVSWLDWRLTVISSNFVALLLIISLAITIHLIVRYREYAQDNPDWSQAQLVSATVKFMARPCLYTALTTIVAFASLVISDIRPVIDFGWMMTIGLVVALILAFLLMPASLMLLPRDLPKQQDLSRQQKVQAKSDRKALTLYFSAVVEKYGTVVLGVSGLVLILSVIGIGRLQVENRFIDYFHSTTEIYQGLSVIDNNLGGTTSLDIIVAADNTVELVEDSGFDDEDSEYDGDGFDEDPYADSEEDPYADDGYGDDAFGDETADNNNYWLTVSGLKKVERIHDYLDSLPEIGKVQSLAILYKVGKDINGGLNDFELAVMQKSLPDNVQNILVSPFLSPNGKETRISMRIKDSSPGLKRKELVERIEAHLHEKEGYTSDNLSITGLLVLYNNMLQSLFSSQIVTLGAVFLAITLMFVILFRSLKVAIVAILPNILAALSILGTMGLLGLPLDMMTITVAAITVGIGVDDTIHYIHRFKEEIKVDGNYIAAMHRAHASIGRAMYYTSVIIIFGFSIMVLSEFIPTIYFGLLTGLAMFAALMGALLLLPKLILMVKPFATD